MSNQEGLNQLVRERLRNRISNGSMNAQQAIQQLQRESKISYDYIAYLGHKMSRPSDIEYTKHEKGVMMMLHDGKDSDPSLYTIHDNAISQLGSKLGIPTAYLRQLAKGQEWEQELATRILNSHTGWSKQSRNLIRTVGHEVRGVLSDSYRRLNSDLILDYFISTAYEEGGRLADGMMDATRIYIEMLMPEPISIPTAKNGIVEMAFGARLSTSDYGDGALTLRTFMMQGVCLNGMVRENVMRTIHLGARLPENIHISNETYMLDTKTQALAVRDLTRGIFSNDTIKKKGMEIQGASEIVVDMEKELKLLQKGKMLKEEVKGVEKVLMQSNPDDGIEGESTLWKLVSGITAHSRDLEPRRQRDLQEIAGELMDRVKLC